jgi:hypothetical protein
MSQGSHFGSDVRTFSVQAVAEDKGRTFRSNVATLLQLGAPPSETNLAVNVWRDAVTKVGQLNAEVYALFAPPSSLLLQGCTAFDGNASLAAVIMSRAVVEASAHVFLNRTQESDGSWSVNAQTKPVKLVTMLNRLKQAGLSHRLVKDGSRVREHGNLVVHNSVLLRAASRAERASNGAPKGGRNSNPMVAEPLISRHAAYLDLRSAADIEVELARMTLTAARAG